MKTLYMVKYGCGQWEDYHEDIAFMFESLEDAKEKCLQLQKETEQRIAEHQQVYDELNQLDDEDIQEIFEDVVDNKTPVIVSFYEFIDEPQDYKQVLNLFDDEMQQKLLRYAELHEQANSISIFDNEYDNPHYFMSIYNWSDDGQMEYTELISCDTLEK